MHHSPSYMYKQTGQRLRFDPYMGQNIKNALMLTQIVSQILPYIIAIYTWNVSLPR